MRQHDFDIREFADGGFAVIGPDDYGEPYHEIYETLSDTADRMLHCITIKTEDDSNSWCGFVDPVVWEIQNARTEPAADAWRLVLEGMAERIKAPWGGDEDVLTAKQYTEISEEAEFELDKDEAKNDMETVKNRMGDICNPPGDYREQYARVRYVLAAIELTRKTTKQVLAEAGRLIGNGLLGSLFGAAGETMGEDPVCHDAKPIRTALVTDDQIEAHVDESPPMLPTIEVEHFGNWLVTMNESGKGATLTIFQNADDAVNHIATTPGPHWVDSRALRQYFSDRAADQESLAHVAWVKLSGMFPAREQPDKAYQAPTIQTVDLANRLVLTEEPGDKERLERNRALIEKLPDGLHKMPWDE